MGRLLLFGGKGGVGKTTVASATAVWLARSGYRVLLVSSDPAHSTSDSLGVKLTSSPTPVEGVDGLMGMELDPTARIDQLLPHLSTAMSSEMGDTMRMMMGEGATEIEAEVSDIQASELMIPGLDEALAFDQLLKQVENPSFDVILFDTAPTGHTLRFLSLPELLESWMSRILRMMRMAGGMRSILFGKKQQDSLKAELEQLKRRVEHVRRVLGEPELSSFVLVTIPEKMASDETLRAAYSLNEYGIHLGGLAVNRVTPDLDHPFIQERRKVEQGHLVRLKEDMNHLSVAEISLQSSEVHGISALDELGITIHGSHVKPPDGMEPVSVGEAIPLKLRRGLLITPQKNGTLIEMHLPGSRKEDLALSADGQVLTISVNGHETDLELDHEVNVTTAKARFSEDVLRLDLASISD